MWPTRGRADHNGIVRGASGTALSQLNIFMRIMGARPASPLRRRRGYPLRHAVVALPPGLVSKNLEACRCRTPRLWCANRSRSCLRKGPRDARVTHVLLAATSRPGSIVGKGRRGSKAGGRSASSRRIEPLPAMKIGAQGRGCHYLAEWRRVDRGAKSRASGRRSPRTRPRGLDAALRHGPHQAKN